MGESKQTWLDFAVAAEEGSSIGVRSAPPPGSEDYRRLYPEADQRWIADRGNVRPYVVLFGALVLASVLGGAVFALYAVAGWFSLLAIPVVLALELVATLFLAPSR